MILLTDKENKSYGKQKVCCIWKKEFNTDKNDKRTCSKIWGHFCQRNTDLQWLLVFNHYFELWLKYSIKWTLFS